MVRPAAEEVAPPVTTWTKRTARERAAQEPARREPASESTLGEQRPRDGSADTSLGTAQGGCRDGPGELPQLQPPIGKMQMLAKVVLALHLLCLPCPLATIFLA